MSLTLVPDVGEPSPGGDDPDLAALTEIWQRLARPFEPVETIAGLIGLPLNAVAQLTGTVLTTSPEAEGLLDSFPLTIRSLATSMEVSSERCYGSLRGPVLWSETNSARAATAGNPNLFVCMTPSRAYDIDENRILVHALSLVREAGRAALESIPGRSYDDPNLREAKRNYNDAGRFLEHPSLRSVTRTRPKPREIKRTRSSRAKKAYEPALTLLERAAEPVTPHDLLPYIDRRTAAQHRLLMALVRRLELHGARLPDFRVEQGALFTGPLQYYHPRTVGQTHRVSGVVLGQVLVDVPDRLHEHNRDRAAAALAARSGGRASVVVLDESDLDEALRTAVQLARR